jgi:hypothetical protein
VNIHSDVLFVFEIIIVRLRNVLVFTLLALSFCMLEEGCCVGKIVIVVAGVSLVVCI